MDACTHDGEFAQRTNKILNDYEHEKGTYVTLDEKEFLKELDTW
ncbi:MAG: hypothetical protein OXR66_03185 [Candidatus Woesearchaeota archaeon]|nr:hypothetical protein [Candidatus Woesearchaeota archaeon]